MRSVWLLLALCAVAAPAEAGSKAKKPAPAPTDSVDKAPEKKSDPPPAAEGQKSVEALSDDEFQSVLDAIQDAGAYANSRMSALEFAMDGKHFRMEQVGKLVDLFSFSEDRLNVVKLLKGAIVDPANSAVLLAHFAFPSDKEAVTRLLKN